jgi:hypothetical protein
VPQDREALLLPDGLTHLPEIKQHQVIKAIIERLRDIVGPMSVT